MRLQIASVLALLSATLSGPAGAQVFQGGGVNCAATVVTIGTTAISCGGSTATLNGLSINLGGTAAPTAPIQDADSWDATGPSQDPRIVLYSTYAGTGNAHGFRSYRQFNGTGTGSSYNDYDAFSTVNTAGTDVGSHYAGFEARPNIATGTDGVSGASLPRATMFQAIPLLDIGTTVTEYESFMSWPTNVQGNVTTGYGFRARSMNTLANPTWAATAWAFYADSDPSFFGAAVDIGTNSYASGLQNLSVMNTGRQRLLSVGTPVGGGGIYVAGLGSTAVSSGRPTVDNSVILIDRETTAQYGGVEWAVSGANNGYGFKLTAPNAASGSGSRTTDLLLLGRSNNATWSELLRFAPNTAAVGIGNDGMAANLSVGSSTGTFRVYNAFTDTSNGEWYQASWSGGVLSLGTNKNGTGSARSMSLITGGTAAMTISTSQVINLPVVATGTPAASLCLDGSGNIIKKTTSGACI